MQLVIDSYDLSDYVQAAADNFDPANAFQEPQFAGNTLSDGDLFISMTRRNREWLVPLLIVSDSNDNLNATVRTINSHLKQGVTLEFKEDGATASTYFDVESAVLEPDYKYQRNRQGVGKFLLKVWTRPLGHTGTTRIVGTSLSTCAVDMPVASLGIGGDAPALMQIRASKPAVATSFGMIGWGFHPHPSFRSAFLAGDRLALGQGASFIADAQSARATVVGGPLASGGSPQVGIGLVTNGATYGLATFMDGDTFRIFASLRVLGLASGFGSDSHSTPSTFPAVARVAIDDVGERSNGAFGLKSQWRGEWKKVYGATAFSSANGYNLYDFGSITVPPGGLSITRHDLYVEYLATNLATTLASSPFRTEGLFLMPLHGLVAAPTMGNTLFGLEVDDSNASKPIHYAYDGGDESRPRTAGVPLTIPPYATGVVSILHSRVKDRPTSATAAQLSISLGVREQFQYFR